ncbi:MAG: trypsin-like peptidase domain-containing protein [Roseovarius sp.]
MSFLLKPTRMSVTDLRPSLSYRVSVPARSRTARHWVELVLSADPDLMAPEAATERTAQTFAGFNTRFPLIGDTAVIHIPPATLLALSGASRIYAGAALFDAEDAAAPVSLIRPDADSVYVHSAGFTGAGIAQRFGFAGRPNVTGAPQTDPTASHTWAGDHPTPSSSPPVLADADTGLSTEGTLPMNSQSFMHHNTGQHPGPHTRQAPAQPVPAHAAGAMDYDDGFGAPPPAMPPQTQPMGHMDGGLPYGGANQPLAEPYDYVLPEFDSYNPLDILRTLGNAWSRYSSFTAGVADTSQFPFSAIVLLRMHVRLKSDPTQTTSFLGTGFYIANNLILTAAHNMADDGTWSEAHSIDVFVAMNSTNGVGGALDPAHAVSAYSVTPSDWTLNPHYTTNGDAHDLAVIRVGVAPPNGDFFEIADDVPGAETKIAVCGYAGSSRAQDPRSGLTWQKLLPKAQSDGKQHLDADRVRSTLAGGEAIAYNLHTLKGTSGAPVFMQPDGDADDGDATQQMKIVAVHRRGRHDNEPNTNFENVGVLLTRRKKAWALSGGAASIALDTGALAPQHAMAGEQGYAQPMVEPATWVAIASLVGTATSAGIAGLKSSDGDIHWELQKMQGWLKPGAHPTPSMPEDLDPSQVSETTFINIKSPSYIGTFQGNMFAHFHLRFRWDGTGVGGIVIDKRPHDTADNLTGGLQVSMQIVPLLETAASVDNPNHQVAVVEVTMQYSYVWTASNSDHVKVIYRFYGDGTYESRVVGGQSELTKNSMVFAPQSRT